MNRNTWWVGSILVGVVFVLALTAAVTGTAAAAQDAEIASYEMNVTVTEGGEVDSITWTLSMERGADETDYVERLMDAQSGIDGVQVDRDGDEIVVEATQVAVQDVSGMAAYRQDGVYVWEHSQPAGTDDPAGFTVEMPATVDESFTNADTVDGSVASFSTDEPIPEDGLVVATEAPDGSSVDSADLDRDERSSSDGDDGDGDDGDGDDGDGDDGDGDDGDGDDGDGDDDSDSDGAMPGFGLVAGAVAVLASMGLLSRVR